MKEAKKVEPQEFPTQEHGFTPEELKAENVRIVQEKLQIIKDLNKIKHPLSVTVFTHNKTWTIRNISFWEAMQQRDEGVTEFMHKYLSENK